MSIFENLTEISIHFSKVQGTPIFENRSKEKRIGKLQDFFVDFEDTYPTVLAIQFIKKGKPYYIQWNDIITFSLEKIIISDASKIKEGRLYRKYTDGPEENILKSQYKDPLEFPTLGKVVLDRQIVDTYGKKVVRINDIQLIKTGRCLKVTHAAIGFSSLIRRLGFEPLLDFILKLIRLKTKIKKIAIIINLRNFHTKTDRISEKKLILNLKDEDIKNLHPADLADILEDLDLHGREHIFNVLAPKMAAKTLSEIEPELQATIIKNESPKDAAKIIENMEPDDAADLLNDLTLDKAHAIISNINDSEMEEDIYELLEYEDDEAGGLMSPEVFELSPHFQKSEILKMIQNDNKDFETTYDLYIIDENGRLIGTCSLYKLLIQKENISVGEIMNDRDIKSLYPKTSWREVASFMSKYNLINVPIINQNQKLLGIISVDDILPWLLKERS